VSLLCLSKLYVNLHLVLVVVVVVVVFSFINQLSNATQLAQMWDAQ